MRLATHEAGVVQQVVNDVTGGGEDYRPALGAASYAQAWYMDSSLPLPSPLTWPPRGGSGGHGKGRAWRNACRIR